MLNPDGTLTDEMVESIFDEAVLQMFQEPTIKHALSTEQKRNVLKALDTNVQVSEDGNLVSIGLLFFKVTVDDTGETTQLSIEFDANKLMEFYSKIPKK